MLYDASESVKQHVRHSAGLWSTSYMIEVSEKRPILTYGFRCDLPEFGRRRTSRGDYDVNVPE